MPHKTRLPPQYEVKFSSNGAAPPGAPRGTLYSLFAGRGTQILGEGGSDGTELVARWTQNLAVMLANPTTDDVEVIARLGDRLLARGRDLALVGA